VHWKDEMLADKYVTADPPYRGSASPPLHEQVVKFRKALSIFNSQKNGYIKFRPLRASDALIRTDLRVIDL